MKVESQLGSVPKDRLHSYEASGECLLKDKDRWARRACARV